MGGLQYAEVPKHYTLALTGSIQKFTLAKDVDGTTLDAGGTVNVFVDEISVQLSNDAGVATNKCFIAYKTGGAPSALDKTNALLDLVPGNSFIEIPQSKAGKLRGDQTNLRDYYAKGVSGDYLHIVVPRRDAITTS